MPVNLPKYTPQQRANNTVALVRVGDTAFTYQQIAARLGCTPKEASAKVRRIKGRKSNNRVTWATLGLEEGA